MLYMQDSDNMTYFSQCLPNHEKIDISCNMVHQEEFQGQINNWASTIFISKYTLKKSHLIAYTTKRHYNRVNLREITDINSHEETTLNLGAGYAGNITGVEVYGKYMFINLKYYKTILVFDLELVMTG